MSQKTSSKTWRWAAGVGLLLAAMLLFFLFSYYYLSVKDDPLHARAVRDRLADEAGIDPWLAQAFLLYQEGNYQEALRAAESILSHDPESHEAAIVKGDCETRLHRFSEAAASYEEALRRIGALLEDQDPAHGRARLRADELTTRAKLDIVQENREWTLEEVMAVARSALRGDGP